MKTPMQTRSDTEEFETRSLSLAAYLICTGHQARMIRVTRLDGQTVKPFGAWRFAATSRLKLEVEAYHEGQAKVDPQTYHRVLTDTRNAVMDFVSS